MFTPLDVVRIDSLPVECVVGIYPNERTSPQPLVVTVEMRLDLTASAEAADIRQTVDYAAVAREVDFILTAGRFQLLETAALALCHYLARGNVRSAKIGITKPRALERVGVPSISMEREAFPASERSEIFASPDAGVFVLRSPGDVVERKFPWSTHQDLALPDQTVLRVYGK